jgi:hypothetical protein
MNLFQKLRLFSTNLLTYLITYFAFTKAIKEPNTATVMLLLIIPIALASMAIAFTGGNNEKRTRASDAGIFASPKSK